MQGKETKAVEEAGAGDIVALAKLKDDGHGRHAVRRLPARCASPAYEFPPAGHLLRHHAEDPG